MISSAAGSPLFDVKVLEVYDPIDSAPSSTLIIKETSSGILSGSNEVLVE
jgi:hypothetical protein